MEKRALVEKRLLSGAIDMHIHTSPDVVKRRLNDIEAAEDARENGMRAIVIKSHVMATVGRAYLVNRIFDGIKIFGGVCLNEAVGGINPAIVRDLSSFEEMAFVWMPTTSAHNDVRRRGGEGIKLKSKPREIEEILGTIAERGLVLATGHLSVDESLALLDLARSSGVKKAVVNHPMSPVIGASIGEQKELARLAYLEHCYVACMKGHGSLDLKEIARAIKGVGAERCIMATDLGQEDNPSPVDGMLSFISSLLRLGISEKEIEVMVNRNPAKLLGMEGLQP
jgi:hypothetical protein